MKLIYTARDEMEAHFLQALLEQEGITSVIQGEALEGAWGNLPITPNAMPGVWVNDDDLARAKPIADEYQQREIKSHSAPESGDAATGVTWKCPKCGEEVEDQFDECWNCGAERPGLPA
jgi:hypothetical protein